jgi:hypothetical protein
MPTLVARPRRALATVLLLLAALTLHAAPARAEAPTHASLFTYYASPEKECPPGSSTCPRFPPPHEGLEDACGVTVDSQGDIYVSDYYHDVVDVFGPGPEYLTQIKAESNGNGPCGLAVDANGDVYVDNWRQNVVRYAPSEFPPTSNTTYGPGAAIDSGVEGRGATGVALDPATGNLYVDDRTYVAEYHAPIASGDEPLSVIGLGTLGKGYGVAVSDFAATEGDVYVADSISGTVKVYSPSEHPGSPVDVIDGAGTPQDGFSSLVDSSLAVDQSDGHVFVVDDLLEPFEHPAAAVDEFNGSGEYRGQFAQGIVDAEPSGLALDPSGDVFLTTGNSEVAAIEGFGPTLPAHTLSVAKTGAGDGTITSAPSGINCASSCSAEYNVGEALTLIATPAAGSSLAGWSVNGSPATCPGTGACHLVLSADTEVSAEFEVLPPQPLSLPGPSLATSPLSPAAAAQTVRPAVALRLARPTVSGAIASLKAIVPTAGSLVASGPGLIATAVDPLAAGPVTLSMRLSPAAGRALRKAKRHRLELKTRVTFTPSDGGSASTATTALTFKANSQEKR